MEAVVSDNVSAFATTEIVDEYHEIVQEMISRKQGNLSPFVLATFIGRLHMIETTTTVSASRDPDDDKFLECAIDSKSLYIVSGDKDLLDLENYKGIEIINAADFCSRFLP